VKKGQILVLVALTITIFTARAQNTDGYKYSGSQNPEGNFTESNFRFNGYTNYWHDIRDRWIRYGNLFKISVADANYTIAQSRLDIADDMKIPGLDVEEGFVFNLMKSNYILLEQPSLKELEEKSAGSDLLVLANSSSEAGRKLLSKLPGRKKYMETLGSHQFNAADFTETEMFCLEKGNRKIFVIASKSDELIARAYALVNETKVILGKYDLKRGWFGAETLLKSVTCTAGHPLDVIGRGMNEGNSWFTFSGYMDIFAENELNEWLGKLGNPVITDVGTYMNYIPTSYTQAIFGCDNYDDLKLQSMYTLDFMLKYVHDRNGYAFRSVYDPASDMFHYDGYIAGEGNKEQIDNENVPFVTATGSLDEDAVPCMVLFTAKGQKFSRELMWDAIMKRNEVSVLESGKMLGPASLRNALELLLLDRVWLDEYFGSRIVMEASTTNDYQAEVNITNTYQHAVSGTLEMTLPPELKATENLRREIKLPAGASQTIKVPFIVTSASMNMTNPILVSYKWETGSKSTITMSDLPPAISAHQLLYGHAPAVEFPVTVHNFTGNNSFPVRVDVLDKNDPSKIIFSSTQTGTAVKGSYTDMNFSLKLREGGFNVKISALGTEMITQLGVGKPSGSPTLLAKDLDGDGVDEYIMENDSVRITLLTTGGRIIEYHIKSRDDNALYKIWPIKPVDDKRPFRKRGYYPYGGFEDFLGQASMETHKVYSAEILKKEGDYVQVRMTADYFGNKLVKTYTLYGNSPLLECRFAMSFINPEANMIAPVPVLELGKKHWSEDAFIVPDKGGIKEFRMLPERYYGGVFFPTEGWDAGYDTSEDIAFVSAFPVRQPLYLHMFLNHPSNPDAHFYCHEFQPWVPIKMRTTTYFTFYMWGTGSDWRNGVKELRDRNLITVR